jgi:hypothetical protein
LIPPSHLPDYVERGSEQVWRQPFSAQQADLYGFVTPADRSAIDLLLQRDLVGPSGGAVDYRCAHPNVILTFGSIAREASLDPFDAERGYISEREVSVWCLAADVNAGGRLVWYLPYIFTNSGQTVATGREIFGYPKQLGFFEDGFLDELKPTGGTTTVKGYAIDPFGPGVAARTLPMISLTRLPGAEAASGIGSVFAELESVFGAGLSVDVAAGSTATAAPSGVITPAGAPRPVLRAGAPSWIDRILGAIEGKALTGDSSGLILDMVTHTTLVFLKQFRDAACASKACYQAVIEAPLTIDELGATCEMLDPNLFELTIESWASDPIARDLGIDAGTALIPDQAFRAQFSFDIDLGLEVWRAPT